VGEHDRLDTIAEDELLQHARDVGHDGGLADEPLALDLGVRDTPFAIRGIAVACGQVLELLWVRTRDVRANCLITRLVTAGERTVAWAGRR
jgi:hypothetical protein